MDTNHEKMEKARARRKLEKQRKWERDALARRKPEMWKEIRAALHASAQGTLPLPPSPMFLLHWETWDCHRWQWCIFATAEEAWDYAKRLRGQGAHVYGVSKL